MSQTLLLLGTSQGFFAPSLAVAALGLGTWCNVGDLVCSSHGTLLEVLLACQYTQLSHWVCMLPATKASNMDPAAVENLLLLSLHCYFGNQAEHL